MLLCCRRQRWLILYQIEQSLLFSFSRTAVFIVLTTKGCHINKYCFTRYADKTNNCAIIRVVFDLRWIDTTYIQTTMEILNDRIQCRKCI